MGVKNTTRLYCWMAADSAVCLICFYCDTAIRRFKKHNCNDQASSLPANEGYLRPHPKSNVFVIGISLPGSWHSCGQLVESFSSSFSYYDCTGIRDTKRRA